MGIFSKLTNYFYERDRSGNNYYWIGNGNCEWPDLSDKLNVARTNPILMPAINYIAERFANANFYVEKSNGEITQEHPIIQLLENPNPYQSRNEFLKSFIWYKKALGFVYVYNKSSVGTGISESTSLYNLNSSCIQYKTGSKTPMLFNDESIDYDFIYNCDQGKIKVNTEDIIPFYDLSNGLCDDFLLTSPSRLDALKKPITTIDKSYDAKNRIIPQNGDRLITDIGKEHNLLGLKEKEDIQNRLNGNYGLGVGRSRNIVTGTSLDVKSLHIPLSDLGLDDSIIKDAEKIVLGMGIPLDGLKYDPKKSTFENQLQSEISFYQNTISVEMEDFTNSLTTQFLKEEGSKLIAKYDHLPIFQREKNKELDTLQKKIDVLNNLLGLGVEKDQALKLSQLHELEITEKTINNE